MPRLLQALFWAAIVMTFYVTLKPVTVIVPGNDKTQHLVTFGLLTCLARAAYPRARLLAIGAALSGLGGLIELLQPYFGRSDDLLDWMADSVGIVLAIVVMGILRLVAARNSQSPL